MVHTADWDHSHDIDRRRVAIIGTGVTAVQLIPELAKKAAELTVYQRTAIWVVPKVDFPIRCARSADVRAAAVCAAPFAAVTDVLAEVGISTAVVNYRKTPFV